MKDAASQFENPEEVPLRPTAAPTVAGSSGMFQSMAWTFRRGDDTHKHLARQLLLRAGVWLPVELYQAWPVLLPWVVRDNSLKKGSSASKQGGELNTACPTTGLRRSDNSPVGTIKNGLSVHWAGGLETTFGTKGLKGGKHEWMQSHCWSGLAATGHSTATDPLTNSFVPNLVWLPHALGRMTDDEELVFAEELRAIAWARYRYIPVAPAFQALVNEAWSRLEPPGSEALQRHDLDRVNEFALPASFYLKRRARFAEVWSTTEALVGGRPHEGFAKQSKYIATLAAAPRAAHLHLHTHLAPFAEGAAQFEVPSGALQLSPLKKTKKNQKGIHSMKAHTPVRYRVTGPSGVFDDLPRSVAAVRLVHEVVAAGVSIQSAKFVLKANLREVVSYVPGRDLWQAMVAEGAPGTPGKWYVDQPVHAGGSTWVLKANSWTEEAAQKVFPKLVALAGGQVSITATTDSEPT